MAMTADMAAAPPSAGRFWLSPTLEDRAWLTDRAARMGEALSPHARTEIGLTYGPRTDPEDYRDRDLYPGAYPPEGKELT
jgi:hypothetical protein